MATVVAEIAEAGSYTERWYQLILLLTAATEGPHAKRALVATAGRPITPPELPEPSVWEIAWGDNPDPQLVEDLSGFFQAYLTGRGRFRHLDITGFDGAAACGHLPR